MSITISQIKKDISEYRARIQKARAELDSLPGGYLEFKDHKRREKIRRECEAEIKHVKGLISYANEGILMRQKERKEHG